MSNPTPPADPQYGLAYTTALHLIPLFKTAGVDTNNAYQMALSALDAYAPESKADFINAARTIAFSMATLALLGQTASEDMTMAAKLRAFGRANTMNRSADQSERTMMLRRRYQAAAAPIDQPAALLPTPQPKLTHDEVEAALAEAMQEYQASRPKADAAPVPSATPAMSHPAITTNPVQPPAAIRHTVATQPATPSFRSSLLAQAAVLTSIGQNVTHNPAALQPPLNTSRPHTAL